MKSKFSRIIAALAALFLIIFVAMFANSLVGNPISKLQAKKDIRSYLTATYPDTDFQLDNVAFNFKFKEYNGYIISPSSKDSHFSITWRNGEIIDDDYEFNVAQRYNTLYRYETEARDQIRPLLVSISGISIEHLYVSICKEYYESDEIRSLVLDSPYDKSMDLPLELSITYNSSGPTLEEYASLLEQIHEVLDLNGYTMKYYSIDNSIERTSSVHLNASNISPKDIESNNLSSLLKEALNKDAGDSNDNRDLYVFSFKK